MNRHILLEYFNQLGPDGLRDRHAGGVLDRVLAADVDADASVELEGLAAGLDSGWSPA